MPTTSRTTLATRAAGSRLMILLAALAAVVATALSPTAAEAERPQYRSERSERDVAGQFDYYALVLSWSPSYCAERDSRRDGFDPQCDARRERPYAFVLHGLWPQHTRGYPERCWTRDRPFVPRKLIDDMLDIMPSPKLVIHEYKKHGTCSGLGPHGYYDLSRKLFEKITIPEAFVGPQKAFMISPEELTDKFIAANPGMRADMLAIACRGAGNRLREVRVCFSKDGALAPCGANENQRRLCSASRMFVPPVRISPARN